MDKEAILMSTWYERNREKAIQDAKTWRLNNLDHYRTYQNAYRRRKRAEKRTERFQNRYKPVNSLPIAPEGWEGVKISGTIEEFCRRRGIPNDPNFW